MNWRLSFVNPTLIKYTLGLARLFTGAQDPFSRALLYQIMFILIKLDKLQTFSPRPLDDPSFSLPISQPPYF